LFEWKIVWSLWLILTEELMYIDVVMMMMMIGSSDACYDELMMILP